LFYKIKGTDFKAENDWRFRIIIPVIMNGKIHCFTGRDYTGKNPLKYYSSSKQNSVTPIDECLYGIDNVVSDKVVIVEGPTDVWRLGPGSVATFGKNFSIAQIRLLLKYNISTAYIFYDKNDPSAHKKSTELLIMLRSLKIKSDILDYGQTDPGDLDQEEANNLMKKIR
jgi:hypothetical protein